MPLKLPEPKCCRVCGAELTPLLFLPEIHREGCPVGAMQARREREKWKRGTLRGFLPVSRRWTP